MKQFAVIMVLIMAVALTACGGERVAMAEKEAEPTAVIPVTQEEIVNQIWQWEAYQDTADKNNINVSDPENYTITFNEDGTANIKADCNQVSWAFELDGSSLTFNTLGSATMDQLIVFHPRCW